MPNKSATNLPDGEDFVTEVRVTKPKLDRFIERLRSKWPRSAVAVLPFTSEDDPAIRHFIHVPGIPAAELSRVSRRAWTVAFDVFGGDPIPFHLTTVDPETAAKYFPEALGRARWSASQLLQKMQQLRSTAMPARRLTLRGGNCKGILAVRSERERGVRRRRILDGPGVSRIAHDPGARPGRSGPGSATRPGSGGCDDGVKPLRLGAVVWMWR